MGVLRAGPRAASLPLPAPWSAIRVRRRRRFSTPRHFRSVCTATRNSPDKSPAFLRPVTPRSSSCAPEDAGSPPAASALSATRDSNRHTGNREAETVQPSPLDPIAIAKSPQVLQRKLTAKESAYDDAPRFRHSIGKRHTACRRNVRRLGRRSGFRDGAAIPVDRRAAAISGSTFPPGNGFQESKRAAAIRFRSRRRARLTMGNRYRRPARTWKRYETNCPTGRANKAREVNLAIST